MVRARLSPLAGRLLARVTSALAPPICAFCQGCALLAGLEERRAPEGLTELASGQDLPRSIALDEDFVYFATESNSEAERAIRRVEKAGGEVVDLARTSVRKPVSLLVDVTHVYWAETPSNCKEAIDGDRLMRVLKGSAGAAPEQLWQECRKNETMGIAQDSARVYWSQWNGNAVSQLDKATGQVDTLANVQEQPVGVAVDSETIYWTNYDKDLDTFDDVRRLPKDGGEVALFAHKPGNPTWITLDETDVYWVTESGLILKLAKDRPDGAEPTELASGLDTPGGIALDATYAYVTDSGTGKVLRVRKDGSEAPTDLASDQSYPAGIAVDDESVYWTNFSNGQVMKLVKP